MKTNNALTMKSDLTEVKVMASHFNRFCELNHVDEAISIRLELALVEALNNIVIHAYDNSNLHSINVNFEILQSDLCITLIDSGKEFVKKDTVQNTIENQSIEELAEGNWGIGIIESIADEVIRYRENDQNILKIIKRDINH